MFLKDLGGPISGRFGVTGGEVRLHERGMTFFTELGESTLHFDLPSLGVPRIATGAAAVLEPEAISFQVGGHTLERFTEMARSAIAARVALLATGRPAAPVTHAGETGRREGRRLRRPGHARHGRHRLAAGAHAL